MPTYEYRCRDCGEPLEVVQSFTDGPLTMCPACGGELRKVFQAVGIAFKGSGFYSTDYGRGGRKAKEGDSAGDKSEKKEPAKTESSSGSGEKKAAAAATASAQANPAE